jgi:hypothetical protein
MIPGIKNAIPRIVLRRIPSSKPNSGQESDCGGSDQDGVKTGQAGIKISSGAPCFLFKKS